MQQMRKNQFTSLKSLHLQNLCFTIKLLKLDITKLRTSQK